MKWSTFLCCCVASACASDMASPAIDSVEPAAWREGTTAELVIRGDHFYARARADLLEGEGTAVNQQFVVRVGDTPLSDVTWIDNSELRGTAPADLPTGSYGLTVVTPWGLSDTLTDAVTLGDTIVEQHHSGSAVISADANTAVASLQEPVDPAHSVLFFSMTHDSFDPGTGHISAELSDAGDEVRFFRYDAATQVDISLQFSVLQLAGFDVRRGTLSLTQSEDHAVGVALDPPIRDLTRAFATLSFHTGGSSYNWNDWARIRIADASTLEPYWPNGGCCDGEVRWQLVEITEELEGRVQAADVVLDQAAVSVCDPLQEVAQNQSFLLFSHYLIDSASGTAIGPNSVAGNLTSNTEVCFERGRAGVAIEISYFVVTLASMSAQHGMAAFAADDVNVEVPLTQPVDPGCAVAFLPGQMREGQTSYDGGDDRVGLVWFTVRLSDDGSAITLTRAGTGGPAEVPWTVVEL